MDNAVTCVDGTAVCKIVFCVLGAVLIEVSGGAAVVETTVCVVVEVSWFCVDGGPVEVTTVVGDEVVCAVVGGLRVTVEGGVVVGAGVVNGLSGI